MPEPIFGNVLMTEEEARMTYVRFIANYLKYAPADVLDWFGTDPGVQKTILDEVNRLKKEEASPRS